MQKQPRGERLSKPAARLLAGKFGARRGDDPRRSARRDRAEFARCDAAGLVSTEGLSEGYYAEDLGLFKAHGLNVDMKHLNTAAGIAPAVASGDLDIGCGNVLAIGQAQRAQYPRS